MKKTILLMLGLAGVLSAGAETFRADVIADASVYYTYEWPYSGRTGYSGTGNTVYIASYDGSYSDNYSSAYFKFDLSALPEGSTIEDVTFHVNGWGETVAAYVNYVGDDSWGESNLDYYNQPSNQVGVADTSSWIVTSNTTWMARSLNVTNENWDTAQDIADGELSLRLVSDGTQGSYTAREYGPATAAYLEISYEPPPPSYTLDVVSGVGSPVPAVGSSSVVSGTVVSCSAEDVTVGQTHYICTGWTLTGHEPASGTTNSFDFTITTNATLTWNWATNYWLDVNVVGSGSVDVVDGFYAKDSEQTLSATPDAGWLFMGWSGAAAGTNAAVIAMDSPRAVTATFSDDADNDGLNNTEEAGVGTDPWKSDTDNDGFDDGFEVAQGLSPTNDNSAIASYVASRDDTFELYTSNVVTDVAVGNVLLTRDGTNIVVSLQLEESGDTVTWTNAGPPETWSWPVDDNKKFFRVKSTK